MQIQVYDEDRAANTVRLALEQVSPREVSLVVVDENGDRVPSGRILSITPSGIARHSFVSPRFGFKQTTNNKVQIQD